MNWANPIQYLRDHLKALKWILYLVMAAAIVFDFLIPRHEAHFFGDKIPGFLVGLRLYRLCPPDIRIMKGFAHAWLMKKEDYYG